MSTNTGNHTITPTNKETLLGGHIEQELGWKEHILNNEKSLVRQLTTRINGLSLICKRAKFKTRLTVGNAIVISKLCCLIQLWGGTHDYILKALQVTMNKAARLITQQSWFTPTANILKQCNWLSVKQLIAYHTLLSVYNIVTTQKPTYLHEKMCSVNKHNKR